MKTRTIVLIAIPIGIAHVWATSHICWYLGYATGFVLRHFGLLAVMAAAAMTFTLATPANAGEYTRGRAGMDRGDTSHLTSDLASLNNSMRELSNNQQFLDGLLAYSKANPNDGGQQMLDSLRTAVSDYVSPSDAGIVYRSPANTTPTGSPLHGSDVDACSTGQ